MAAGIAKVPFDNRAPTRPVALYRVLGGTLSAALSGLFCPPAAAVASVGVCRRWRTGPVAWPPAEQASLAMAGRSSRIKRGAPTAASVQFGERLAVGSAA